MNKSWEEVNAQCVSKSLRVFRLVWTLYFNSVIYVLRNNHS